MTESLFAVDVGGGILGNLAIVISAIGLVYLIHELGHLLAARACGMEIRKYYVGFDNAADPRSFAARAVWQRILVILAGSLMNLVFAAACAAVAYRLGIRYLPCILGGTVAGAPAWEVGLRPGDKILQIGRSGQPTEQLRFDRDVMVAVSLHGTATELEMLIRRDGQELVQWVAIRPSDRLQAVGRPATLGVYPANTTRLQESWPGPGGRGADRGQQTLQPGDEIVAVNQMPLPRDERTGEILGHHLDTVLAQHMAEPLKLTVRRPATSPGDEEPAATQAIEVVVPARPMRMMGLAMQVGPIVAVRAGSPADIAGLRPGDVVLTIGGQEIGDPMTLAQRLLPLIGEELQMTVRRDGGKPVSLHVTPEPPTANSPCNPLTPLLLDSLGVAMRVESLVQSVDPHGPAFEAGLCAGDEITEVRFYPTDAEQRRGMHAMFGRLPEEPIELSDESPNWPSIHACIQETRVLPQLDVTYRRGDAVGTALLTPIESEVWSQVDRGLRFEPLQQRRVADSWAEACTAGFGETRAMVGQIVAVLRRLVSGELGTESIGGGPIVVIRAGTSEAAEGPPRLLLFIAFVSINFAFLCCLPIPPLDGGHLLFLVVEGVRGKPVSNKAQLTIIAITVGGFLVLACALLFPCLSQFLRVIGLFRGLGGAGKESG